MRNLLGAWIEKMPDVSFYPESVLLKHANDDIENFSKNNKSEIIKLKKIDQNVQEVNEVKRRLQYLNLM